MVHLAVLSMITLGSNLFGHAAGLPEFLSHGTFVSPYGTLTKPTGLSSVSSSWAYFHPDLTLTKHNPNC